MQIYLKTISDLNILYLARGLYPYIEDDERTSRLCPLQTNLAYFFNSSWNDTRFRVTVRRL